MGSDSRSVKKFCTKNYSCRITLGVSQNSLIKSGPANDFGNFHLVLKRLTTKSEQIQFEQVNRP